MNNACAIRADIEQSYQQISPFELKDKLIRYARESRPNQPGQLLDASRGNPNWTAAAPREAFFTFGQFAVQETRKAFNDGDLAGKPQKNGISQRFHAYLRQHADSPGAGLLKRIIDYGIDIKGFNADTWIYELTDAIIGDNYPSPDRMLPHVEKIVHDYLARELRYETSGKPIKIYAVEGATAAMCYIFDTLVANNIFCKGDKIALMTPIFTPYLEIPLLPRYDLEIVELKANETRIDGNNNWQYPDSEIAKLRDPSIKALFIVNPSNPPSVAMRSRTVTCLAQTVKEYNPNLMIISDDVYGTFVDGFRSIMAVLPYNTLGVYSYSKYFGVTGWRLGTIALHEDNVFDRLINQLSEDKKARARRRYSALTSSPEHIAFIDRVVADSRQVALNHTAGLSTPQQVLMAFLSIFALLDKDNRYKHQTISICRRRQQLLFEKLGLAPTQDSLDAAYYSQLDLLHWASQLHGPDFASYLRDTHRPVDVLLRLAEESSVVLLNGGGFRGPEWSVRVSLANLNDEAYLTIGQALRQILEQYAREWKSQQNAQTEILKSFAPDF